ncbi:probable oligoribonuclease isoform X1 [Mytilus edulis]
MHLIYKLPASITRRYFHNICRKMSSNGGDASPAKKPKIVNDDKSKRFVWVDLEMTGLDIEKEHIIEMACLVTDTELNVIAEGPNLVINQPDEVLDNMGEWCKQHHGESGLTDAVRKSDISLEKAEQNMLNFIKEHTTESTALLAGNSIHADRMFLNKYMPKFLNHLHYRILDVSTVKELCRHWYPEEYQKAPKKKIAHRALDDIKESMQELKFYKGAIFK